VTVRNSPGPIPLHFSSMHLVYLTGQTPENVLKVGNILLLVRAKLLTVAIVTSTAIASVAKLL
jgi:hypothetical protein